MNLHVFFKKKFAVFDIAFVFNENEKMRKYL